jgi:2-hydroxy-3-oxopropionate reductase
MKKIGVFGLGDMGAAITHRLLKKNFEVISTKRGKYMDFIENNSFSVMTNPCDVGASSDIIIFCVDTIENLNKIIFSENGLISSEKLPKYFLDFGTGKPSNCIDISNQFLKQDKIYVDMPIGRTPAHAREGKLNLFISAKKDELNECIQIIQTISENQFYLDRIGEGTKIKLINNFYGQTVTLIFGQLLKLANDQNIDINNLVNVMSAGPLFSDILNAIKPYYEHDSKGGMEFSINNAYKDLIYFKEEFGANELVNEVIKYFEKVIDNGFGAKSVAEVSKYAN